MGWQTPVTGEVRMSAEPARKLLELGPVDWYRPGQTFGEYLGGGVTFDNSRGVLSFDLGWVAWRLAKTMHLVAAMKDVEGTDTLVHQAPTYDAGYASGTFFVESSKWAYVGAGPMFNVSTGSYDRPAHVGPPHPTVQDVREWNHVGPLARSVSLTSDGVWLEVETVRHGTFRNGVWTFPDSMRLTDDGLVVADGGASLSFTYDGREHTVSGRDLYDARER